MSDRAPSDCLLPSWMLHNIHEQKWEKSVAALTPRRKLALSYPTFSWSPVFLIL